MLILRYFFSSFLSLCLHNFSVRFSSTQLDHLTHLIGNISSIKKKHFARFSEGRKNPTSQSLFTFSSSQHKKIYSHFISHNFRGLLALAVSSRNRKTFESSSSSVELFIQLSSRFILRFVRYLYTEFRV